MIGTNPTFTVSQFVAVFNQSLEMMFPRVAIFGEIANFRISKGRWVYFDLKDEAASVRFFGSAAYLPGPLEDGMNLEVYGYPRLHPKFGFSVNFERLRVAGEGSIAKAKKLLQRKLEAEGLFGPERKRTLPYPPAEIGLITSVESAAYSDFIKVLNQRWGDMRIQLADCLVQGADAPAQITNAIELFNQSSHPPEVLVLVRGGGSADDLEVFSTEQVVRAVAASRIPTLVAIGHERDVSLAELAADKRASTPSNAAEILVPDKVSEKVLLKTAGARLNRAIESLVKVKFDNLSQLRQDLQKSASLRLEHENQTYRQLVGLLKALDPQAPLKRGYALVRNEKGKLVKSVKPLKTDDRLSLSLSDGQANVKVLRAMSQKPKAKS